jgi:hypothetical protein
MLKLWHVTPLRHWLAIAANQNKSHPRIRAAEYDQVTH